MVASDLAAVLAYVGAVLLLFAVLFRRSVYPRWTILANFELLSLLEPLATQDESFIHMRKIDGVDNITAKRVTMASPVS
jgi:hypothetical protein